MGLDYWVAFDCAPQQAVPVTDMVRIFKREAGARAIMEDLLSQGVSSAAALMETVRYQVKTPDGEVREESYRLEEAFDDHERLQAYAMQCGGCSIGGGSPFGCMGTVSYPISIAAEEWLASLAARAWEAGGEHQGLLRFIIEKNVNGQRYGRLRSQFPGALFEGDTAASFVYKKTLFGKKLIDTNQLFSALNPAAELPAGAASLIASCFGERRALHIVEGEVTKEDMEAVLAADASGAETYRLLDEDLSGPPDGDDASTGQLRRFLHVLARAAANGATVHLNG